LDSIIEGLEEDFQGTELYLFFFAVKESGWEQIREACIEWMGNNEGRIIAYIGTDLGITTPEAIELMIDDEVQVFLVTDYPHTFHPKLVCIFDGDGKGTIWSGSNNLTISGMTRSAEFGTRIDIDQQPQELIDWIQMVDEYSTEATPEMIVEYREQLALHRVREGTDIGGGGFGGLRRFIWRRREQSLAANLHLVIEVLGEPGGGAQVQIPTSMVNPNPARDFFGSTCQIDNVVNISLGLRQEGEVNYQNRILRVFGNNTIRVSVGRFFGVVELQNSRPCLLVFSHDGVHENGNRRFLLRRVTQAEEPWRYQRLINCLGSRTSAVSKLHGYVTDSDLGL